MRLGLLQEGDRVRRLGAVRGRLGHVARVAWTGIVIGARPGTLGAIGQPLVVLRAGAELSAIDWCITAQRDWLARIEGASHGR